MIRQLNRKTERRRGAAIVEAALVLPIFFMVILGIVEFGRAFMVTQMVQNAAREGCRRAITGGYSNASIISEVKSDLTAAGISSADVTVTITVTVASGNPTVSGNDVTAATTKDLVNVVVTIPFDEVALIPGDYLDGKTLTGRSTMRHE